MKRMNLIFLMFLMSMGTCVAGGILYPNQILRAGQRIYSNNSRYFAQMQADGNFAAYTANGEPLWSTNTTGLGADYAIMQTDGNFVLYSSTTGREIWSSNTSYNQPGYAAISDFGQWIVFRTRPVWSSNTSDLSGPIGANAAIFGNTFHFERDKTYSRFERIGPLLWPH